MSDWLTTVTLTIEAADYGTHLASASEPSHTRLYIVRGERPPLHIADPADIYATVELIAGLLTDRYPVTVDAVVVVTTATAQHLDTVAAVERIRLAYGLTRHHRASVIRRASDPDTPVVTAMAAGAFPTRSTPPSTIEPDPHSGSATGRPADRPRVVFRARGGAVAALRAG